MKVIYKYVVYSIVLVLLSSCASTPSVPFEGSTNASQRLANDTYKMVALITNGQGCEVLQKVKVTVLEPPTGKPGELKSKERWIVYGCNNQYPYSIEFTEDGKGGTYFSVSKE